MITSAGTFAQWYVDAPGVNRTVVGSLSLTHVGAGNTYVYDSAQTPLGNTSNTAEVGFFPLDGLSPPESWGITPTGGETPPTPGLNHDYGFTTELHNWFTYQGGEVLNFTGDDDVWVFINNRLAVDLGGVHPRQAGSITLDDATAARMGLVKGNAYEMALFHAERHTSSSNFELTLGGFIKLTTHCASVCGDGIKAPDEACDDGPNNGKPGSGCSSDCKFLRAL
jgi:fibro-slime domain-containing protein